MKISKVIEEIISSQFASNLPAGAEYDKDAPYNQKEPKAKQGDRPSEEKYMPVWYGYNAGIVILKDASGKLYTFDYSLLDKEDVEQYADREVVGYDEDGWPEYSDVEFDGKVIAAYVNDNLDKLTTGVGKEDYNDDADIVLIDQDLKDYLLDFADKYLSDNKAELIKVLNSYEPQLNESATMSEAKMPNEPFVKVYFEYDFPSNENRLKLINIIKDYFGEPLSKGRDDEYWSTYIPELELDEFLSMANEFNPSASSVTIQANRFKPLTKELKDGDIIKFFDYTISENNPPRAEGYLKPNFIQRNRSLMKWDGGSKEAWIDNSMIDKYYFYHGDVSDTKNPQKDVLLDPNNPIIIFDDDQFYGPSSKKVSKKSARFDDFKSDDENEDSYEGNTGAVEYDKYREEKLRSLIKQYGGTLNYMFGNNTDSKGRWYTLIPLKNADDFIQAAEDFGAYYGSTAGNIYLEDKALNEIRKIVRAVINSVIK